MMKKFGILSFKSKYSYLLSFFDNFKIKPQKLGDKKDKEIVYNSVAKLYNKRFEKYYNEFGELPNAKKIRPITNSSL